MSNNTHTSHTPPLLLLETLFPTHTDIPDGISLYKGDDVENIPTPVSRYPSRPHVTLTFAQSIDAKIAGKGGQQLILSGKESMVMTHWMRTMHDAILVGIGTALNDDPQLNTRHVPALPEHSPHVYHLPRPVILDTHLRLSPTCKLLKNYKEGRGRRPWVFGSAPADQGELSAWSKRKELLEGEGAKVHIVAVKEGHISLPDFLKALHNLNVRSIMVEGGARIIQSFLRETQPGAEGKDVPIVDSIIITVAPTIVGTGGVGYECDLTTQLARLHHKKTELFGRDVVMALKF